MPARHVSHICHCGVTLWSTAWLHAGWQSLSTTARCTHAALQATWQLRAVVEAVEPNIELRRWVGLQQWHSLSKCEASVRSGDPLWPRRACV